MLTFFLGLLSFVTGFQTLSLNTVVNHTQTSIWTYFELESGLPPILQGTLRFKLETDPSSKYQLVLAESIINVPVFNVRRTMVHADNVDYNAWKLGRKIHYLTFPFSLLSFEGPIYIGVGMASLWNATVPFTLSAELSSGPLCPNDCSQRGQCSHYFCKCDSGFINYDCSVPALPMKQKKWYSIDIAGESTEYAYIQLSDVEILNIHFKWQGPFSVVSLNWKGYTPEDLPSETNYYSQTLLPSNQDKKTLVFDEEIMNNNLLYIAFINKYHPGENLTVQIKIENKSLDDLNSYDCYFIVLGICVVFLIAVMIVLAVYGCRAEPFEMYSSRFPALPEQYLNEHFAKVKYHELQGQFEIMCIVCLEQFSEDDEVRQLTCKHVFHAKCIEEWFKHNVVCCLCKREYTPNKGLNSTVDI